MITNKTVQFPTCIMLFFNSFFLLILIFYQKKLCLSHSYSLINYYLYFQTEVMDYYLNNSFPIAQIIQQCPREGQILYYFTYMWNLKKQNKWTNITNRNRVIDTENTWLSQGRGLGGWDKEVKEIRKYKLPVTKWMSHRCERYSVGNKGNNYVISLYGDRW